jgi:hypothetical protein
VVDAGVSEVGAPAPDEHAATRRMTAGSPNRTTQGYLGRTDTRTSGKERRSISIPRYGSPRLRSNTAVTEAATTKPATATSIPPSAPSMNPDTTHDAPGSTKTLRRVREPTLDLHGTGPKSAHERVSCGRVVDAVALRRVHRSAISSTTKRRFSVELGGFEPPTPSLRKMQSNHSDQGKRRPFTVLWRGCGTGHVRQREIWHDSVTAASSTPLAAALTPDRSTRWRCYQIAHIAG